MRREILILTALLACPLLAQGNDGQPRPASFNRTETAGLARQGIDLNLVKPSARSELRAALDSGDPARAAEAKRRLRRSQTVYASWLENPAAARRLMNSPAGSAERRSFETDFGLLTEALPPTSVLALQKLGLNAGRVEGARLNEPDFESGEDDGSVVGSDEPVDEEPAGGGNSGGRSIIDDAWSNFCRIAGWC
jgi:hypothetical protein